jgi:hypothetical protein
MFSSIRSTIISGAAAMAILAGSALPMFAQSAQASGDSPLGPAPAPSQCLSRYTPKLKVTVRPWGDAYAFVATFQCLPNDTLFTLNVWPSKSSGFTFGNLVTALWMPAACGGPDMHFNLTYTYNGVSYSTPVITLAPPPC